MGNTCNSDDGLWTDVCKLVVTKYGDDESNGRERTSPQTAAPSIKPPETAVAAPKQMTADSSQKNPTTDGTAVLQETTPVPVDAVVVWTDPATGLMWTKKDNGVDVTWQEATDYCRNLQTSGQSDWRLPTISELQGIYDSSINAPDRSGGGQALPWQVKGKLVLSAWGEWSSTQGNTPGQAWVFGFGDGKPFSYRFEGLKKPRALCVRGNSAPDEKDEQDARLNQIYHQLIAQLQPDADAVRQLREEERGWIKRRDAQCGQDMACQTRIIKERADELLGRLKTE
jgi:hypothetical protein